MANAGRLRLDEVISSVPELGPTLPDGGYSWIVLAGAMVIQVKIYWDSSIYIPERSNFQEFLIKVIDLFDESFGWIKVHETV